MAAWVKFGSTWAKPATLPWSRWTPGLPQSSDAAPAFHPTAVVRPEGRTAPSRLTSASQTSGSSPGCPQELSQASPCSGGEFYRIEHQPGHRGNEVRLRLLAFLLPSEGHHARTA